LESDTKKSEMATQSNEEKENGLISRLLQVSVANEVKTPLTRLSGLAEEILNSDGSPLLSVERIDDILIERLSMADCKNLKAQLVLLSSWIEKVEGELGKSNISPESKNVCGLLLNVIERYISTVVNYPDVFGLPERTLTRSGEILSTMHMNNETSVLVLIRVCDIVASEEGVEAAIEFASPLILSLIQRIISTRSFDVCGEQASGDINTLGLFLKLSTSTYTPQIITKTQLFMPPVLPLPTRLPTGNREQDNRPFNPNHKNVFVLQTGTLIGRLLMPSTVDHILLPPAESQKSAKHANFSNLSRRNMTDFNASVAQVRAQLGAVIDSVLSILQPLIRSDEETRPAVLKWIATAIKKSSSRSTMGWQHQVAPHGAQLAEHLVSPQAMQQLGGSLEKFRMFTNMQSVRFNGLLSTGTCLNLAWSIFELCKPIKVQNCGGVDEFFLAPSSNPIVVELQASLAGESRLGDSDRLASITQRLSSINTGSGAFKTQIFWFAVNAIHTLVLPSCKETEMAITVASVFHRDKREMAMNDAYGEFHCFEAVFNHPRFVESLAHVVNLMLVMILRCAGGEATAAAAAAAAAATATPSQPFESMDIRNETSDKLSDSMAVLPACMMDEIVEFLDFYRLMRDVAGRSGPGARQFRDIVDLLDPDLFLLFTIWTLGSDKVKNPNIRGKAAKVLKSLATESNQFSSRIERAPYCVRNIIPACIRVFSAVEKTKQSYYDIRMHVKFELRIPIQQLFELLLNNEEHRVELKSFVGEFREDFYKFASQLLNDTTYLLEEGLDTLIAIRRKEEEGVEDVAMAPAVSSSEVPHSVDGTAGLGVDRGIEEDDQNEEGQDMYRRSRHDPKEHCRQYMRMGHQTMSTLHQMCKQTCDILVDDKVVLDQMITSCLDPSLDRLVGPKCLQLKGQKSKYDFALFEFDPKKLLYQILEMYVYLARRGDSRERVAKVLSEDKRYYRPETLRKAINIARREHLISPDMLKEFEEFSKFTNEFSTKLQNAMDSVEIPDEFLDPIMAELMVDPVLLPTSHNIMERKHIMRIILSDDHDPFNRQPLKPADLIPQDDLRKRIHEFARQHSIPLDTDNDDESMS